MEAILRRVKKHLDETLSDEEIMKELGITLEELQENFGRGVKLRFAVGNISRSDGGDSEESEEAFRWDVEWWGDYEENLE
jgi:DNA-directed RNA polymerase specialized sigma subunit